MKTLAVLQPGYIPWLGFFDQLARADVFVFYDDVQYDKNGWRNRNRIKAPSGPMWLTVPVRSIHLEQSILETTIDDRQPWRKKHINTIEQFYRKAPYFNLYFETFRELLLRPWPTIADLDIAVVEYFVENLGLETKLYRSSQLEIAGDRIERLIKLCLHFNADQYLTGNAAKAYLQEGLFDDAGIAVCWQDYFHPEYSQLHGDFVPYLSTLDLLLNCGPNSLDIIQGKPPDSPVAAKNSDNRMERY